MIENRDQSDFAARWESWHREHETQRARPHGFLAITAMHWLDGEPRRFNDVPGAWSSGVDEVRVLLDEGEELYVDGQRVTGEYEFGHVDEHGVSASFGDALVEVCRRGRQFMIRPRHPDNAVRTGYTGTATYPPSVDWVVSGTLVPYDVPQSIAVGATVEGLTHVYESPGEIEFELAGKVLHLIAFNGDGPGELDIIFTDATSGSTTYAACRFLSADAADSDDHVTLDFNRATNPPCAYTDLATCPLPPAGNHLPVSVEAGERIPGDPH